MIILEKLAGTLLFLAVLVWAAYKLSSMFVKEEKEDEDNDIHLGI